MRAHLIVSALTALLTVCISISIGIDTEVANAAEDRPSRNYGVIGVSDPDKTLTGSSDCKACNKLIHDLVAAGFDVGTGGGQHYYVVKYNDGPVPAIQHYLDRKKWNGLAVGYDGKLKTITDEFPSPGLRYRISPRRPCGDSAA